MDILSGLLKEANSNEKDRTELPLFLKHLIELRLEHVKRKDFQKALEKKRDDQPTFDDFLKAPAGLKFSDKSDIYTFANDIVKAIGDLGKESKIKVIPGGLSIERNKYFIPMQAFRIKDQTDARRKFLLALQESQLSSKVKPGIKRKLLTMIKKNLDLLDKIDNAETFKDSMIITDKFKSNIKEAKEFIHSLFKGVARTLKLKKNFVVTVLSGKYNRILNWDGNEIFVDRLSEDARSVEEIAKNIKGITPILRLGNISNDILLRPENEFEESVRDTFYGRLYVQILKFEKVIAGVKFKDDKTVGIDKEKTSFKKAMASTEELLNTLADKIKAIKLNINGFSKDLGFSIYSKDDGKFIPIIFIPKTVLGVFGE